MGNICDKSEKRFENLHPINSSSQIKNLDILTGIQRERLQVVFFKKIEKFIKLLQSLSSTIQRCLLRLFAKKK